MKYTCSDYQSTDLKILIHHIYEYKKGIRNLVLHTMHAREKVLAESLLGKRGISFYTQTVNSKKINIFFGKESSVKIIQSFGNISLSNFTSEQDFILGIMLGYDRSQQCNRYIKREKLINSDSNQLIAS